MAKNKGGRPRIYPDETYTALYAELDAGSSISVAAAKVGMPFGTAAMYAARHRKKNGTLQTQRRFGTMSYLYSDGDQWRANVNAALRQLHIEVQSLRTQVEDLHAKETQEIHSETEDRVPGSDLGGEFGTGGIGTNGDQSEHGGGDGSPDSEGTRDHREERADAEAEVPTEVQPRPRLDRFTY